MAVERLDRRTHILAYNPGSPYPAITYRQAAVALDVSYTTVWRTFRAMQEAKLIERTGSDRRGTWRIPTPPQLSHE